MDQVRGVLQEQATLLQRFHYERDIALLQVAHAAVDQLGAAARGALAKIALFQQEYVVIAGGGVNGDPDSGGSAAHNDHVPASRMLADATVHL